MEYGIWNMELLNLWGMEMHGNEFKTKGNKN